MPLPEPPCFLDRTASGYSEASVRTNLNRDSSCLNQAQSSHHHQSQSSRPDHAQTLGYGPTQRAGPDQAKASHSEQRSPQLTRYLEDDQRHERIALGLCTRREGVKEEVSQQGPNVENNAFKGRDRGR